MLLKTFIKDPIWKEITIQENSIFFKLINAKEFLRLLEIKQLGVLYRVIPSATHNRFMHCLGSYYVASRFVEKIAYNYDEKTKELVKIAALLHDIGHSAFSHVFETFSHQHHEQWTIKIISSKETEINKILTEHNVCIDDLCKIYNKVHPLKWVNQLISSDLDVDRIDYLSRDSYFIGTKYATIDLDILLSRTKIINDVLCFSEKNINIIHGFLWGRQHMNIDIYDNKNSKIFEWLLFLIIERLKKLYAQNKVCSKIPMLMIFLPLLDRKCQFSVKNFIKINDATFLTFLNMCNQNINDHILNNLFENFMYGRRTKYLNVANFKQFKISHTKLVEKKYIYKFLTINHKSLYSKNNLDQIYFYNDNMEIIPFQKSNLYNIIGKNIKKTKIVLLNENFI